jgi:hypothetical protein
MSIDQSPSRAKSPSRNLFLSAEKYGMTHFDPAQTRAMSVGAPRGVFRVDLRTAPRVSSGPVSFMELASTSPQYMWSASTGHVSYIDVSSSGFRAVAQLATPGAIAVSQDKLDRMLAQRFTSIDQVERATQELGIDWPHIANNVNTLVDNDNVLYASTSSGAVHAYALVDPGAPSAGINVVRTLDLSKELAKLAATTASRAMQQFGAHITGLGLTYDGKLVVLTSRSVIVVDRTFEGGRHTIELAPNEYVTNGMAVDEHGGIYVASDTTMHKIVWTGAKLSADEPDGAWSSSYDVGHQPPSVKFGHGTGSTPTLMGFGDDPDKLVVITDGSDRMKLVAFWRDAVPAGVHQQPGTKSRRIAGQLAITCGLSPLPDFVQTEQSVVVHGYGALVVNNIRRRGASDRLVDVLAGGPVFEPPAGAERVEWDPATRQWRSVWTRADVVGTSMVPGMSSVSNIAFVNGYTKTDGWELTGLDWSTGQTVHRTIFGQDNLGNGAYSLVQFIDNGDLLFNSVGGPIRVRLPAS